MILSLVSGSAACQSMESEYTPAWCPPFRHSHGTRLFLIAVTTIVIIELIIHVGDSLTSFRHYVKSSLRGAETKSAWFLTLSPVPAVMPAPGRHSVNVG